RSSKAYLATECGACIEGTVTGMDGEDPSPILVTLSPSTLRVGGGTGFEPQSIELDGSGEFVFRGIPPMLDVEVKVLPVELAPELADVPRLARGETHELAFDLRPGGVISGQVVDPSGLPLEGADVASTSGRGMISLAGWVRRKEVTDAEGRFTLRGLPVGDVSVIARSDGFVESGFQSFNLIEGEQVKDLVLVLSEGSSLEGRVLWPDGSPVVDTVVAASFDRSALLGADSINSLVGGFGHARTDEEGNFRITALGKGPFTVSASHIPTDARLEEWLSAETQQSALYEGGEYDRDAAFSWRDHTDGVRPGEGPLELVLKAPEVIAGRVVDDAGVAVEEYELVMIRMEGSLLGEIGVEDKRLLIQDPEGRFIAPGLSHADWRVYALAEGYATPAATVVKIPQAEDADPLLITLEPASTASGVVLTPTGAPAANAMVTIRDRGSAMLSTVSEDLKNASTRSDGSGRFVLEDLPSGALDLFATADGYAASVPLKVTLIAGEETADLRLSLRMGGTITGEIYNKDGELTSNATIQVIKP
ncbi:MAG: carboxypeptidase-like regulatory domain-containing protein, partial [Planctomycetes bacterium]|nr:carboxypeptidase-like regulatory domain-containing protein [Planctomycetota bacterium]